MTNLGYFTLETADIAKAKAFYSALFGWTFDDDASHKTYAHVAGSDPAFGFTKVERVGGFPNLYFRVDDIAATCAKVTELGG
ncbi:MAG: bleomycin resistance protein, partial [Brevundimonas sp.]